MRELKRRLGFGASAATLIALMAPVAAIAQEATYRFDIPAQDLGAALRAYGEQSNQQIVFESREVAGKQSAALVGSYGADEGLRILLGASGLSVRRTQAGVIVVQDASSPTQLGAADQGPLSDAEEEIVVTGTNIRGSTTASPLTVIGRDQIEARGYTTTQQVLDAVPQNFGGAARPEAFFGGVPGDDMGNNLGLASAVSLRGIGSDATLVLVNGHRFTTMGLGSFFDLGIVPVSAVERVEILTDGASSTYGSDAIAGVVNVILRRDLDGAETLIEGGAVTDGNLSQMHVNHTAGVQWRNGGGLVSLDYFDQHELSTESKSFINERIPDLTFAAFGVLIPNEEQTRLFATVHQDFSPNVRGTLDLLYSDKEASGLYFIGLPYVNVTNTTAYGVEGGIDIDLSQSAQLRLDAGYTDADIASRFLELDPPTSDQDLGSSAWHVDAIWDGELVETSAGAIKLALGASHREERFSLRDVFSGASIGSARSTTAVFAEVEVPLVSPDMAVAGVHSLDLTISGRYEEYSDFGSTSDPKIGLSWSPVADLRLRTTYGTSFRVPSLERQSRGVGVYSISVQNVPDPSAPSGNSVVAGIIGNADLGPETSRNWTLGFDYTTSAFQLSTTYFRIDYSDRIARPAAANQIILANPDIYADFIVRNPSSQDIADLLAGADDVSNVSGEPESAITAFVDTRFRNVAALNVEGIDVSARYNWEGFGGEFTLGLGAQYLLTLEQQNLASTPPNDTLDTVYNPTQLRGSLDFGWSGNGVTTSVSYNHVNEYDNNAVSPSETIDDYNTVDARVAYDFGSGRADALGGVEVSLTAFNLFDEDPPFANVFEAFDASNASPRGRFLQLSLRKQW